MRARPLVVLSGLLLLATLLAVPVTAQEDPSSPEAVAVSYLAERHGVAAVEDVEITDVYTSTHNRVTHVYLRQVVDGVPTDFKATVNVRDGVVIYAVSRFADDPDTVVSGSQRLTVDQATDIAVAAVDAEADGATGAVELGYVSVDDGRARLAYEVEVIDEPLHWWWVAVDADNGEVLQTRDLVDSENAAHVAASTVRTEAAPAVQALLTDPIVTPDPVEDGSSYRVFALPLESPLDGDRSLVDNPADALASPYGWHDTDGEDGPEHTITRGNNVNAYHDTVQTGFYCCSVNGPNHNEADPLSQPDGGSGLDFDHPILSFDASPATYRDAAVTNLFYWNNLMHDITFRYGFDEAAGNFQQTNYTGLGLGEDAVNAEAQDGGFVLNANFATPADGAPGRMQMFLWVDAFRDLGGDVARVHSHQIRDGDVDSGVIAHEYGHGISNRLVGGPSDVSCLRTHDEREGEGWSDFWSYALTMRDGDDGATPRGIGNYVVYYDEEGRQGPGIRITPYSTDMSINPSTYNTVKSAAEPHGVGYVWASMLWDLYWNLVEVHGFNPSPYGAWDTGGNNLTMQLVVDAMKMGPCEPGFVDARDAIIAADAALTGDPAAGVPGENECLIWHTFARRGLGVDADQGSWESKTDGRNGFAVPPHCEPA